MLDASIPPSLVDAPWSQTIKRVLAILSKRKKEFAQMRPEVTSLIGLRQIEQFLHNGLVGRLGLPPGVQLERRLAARRESDPHLRISAERPLKHPDRNHQ